MKTSYPKDMSYLWCLLLKTDVDALSLFKRGISFQTAAPEEERLVLQISMRALGRMKFWDPYLLVDFENRPESEDGALLR